MVIPCKGKSCILKAHSLWISSFPTSTLALQLPLPKGITNKAAFIISELAFSPFHTNKMIIKCKDRLTICGQAALIEELPVLKIKHQVQRHSTLRMCLSITDLGQGWACFSLFLLRYSFHWSLCLIQHYVFSSTVTRKAWKIPCAFLYNPVVSLPSHYPKKDQRKATFRFSDPVMQHIISKSSSC